LSRKKICREMDPLNTGHIVGEGRDFPGVIPHLNTYNIATRGLVRF
jgi:hypothetical protein